VNSSDVTIHTVSPNSAGLLDRVDADVFDHPVQTRYLHAFLANPANVLVVAEADGVVVGMATGIAYIHPDKPLSLFINEVGVSARHQRRGIGRRLIAAILHRGRQLGCREAWVATEVSNAAARALYEATGGVADDERAVVYVYPLGAATPDSSAAGDT